MIRETGNSITDLDYVRQKIVIYKIYLYIQKEINSYSKKKLIIKFGIAIGAALLFITA